jgi:CRISPR/Cas system-associated protein Csx1
MTNKTDIIPALRKETDEIVVFLKQAEKLLQASDKRNFRAAADFLQQSYLLVEKHKNVKLKC